MSPAPDPEFDPVPGVPAVLPDGRPVFRTAARGSGALVGADLLPAAALRAAGGVARRLAHAFSAEDVAAQLEQGRDVVLLVNAGEVAGAADGYGFGDANRVARVAAVARAPGSGEVVGLELEGFGFVPTARLARGWLGCGGIMAYSDRAGG